MLEEFIAEHKLSKGFSAIAQSWYIPLANTIASHHNGASRPYILGINGCQGSGKSTLTAFIAEYLRKQHKNVVVLSLDDFYLDTYARNHLAEQVHPLLATRGVPGTHDTEMIMQTLQALSTQSSVSIPRFNKATDNPFDSAQWPRVEPDYDLVIFEGWCWGVQPQDEATLARPVNTLEEREDPDGSWRTYVNQALKEHYLPCYQMMDAWLMLEAPSFDVVYKWRKEQEHKLREKVKDGAGIMTDEQIYRFIMHYQRLTESSLATLPAQCDWVFTLDEYRKIIKTTGFAL